jgi:hypothetical protein
MGFLKPCPELEDWLQRTSERFRPLNQNEYRKLVVRWRDCFEQALVGNDFLTGASAKQEALCRLPCDVFVFSVPGYRWLPSPTDPKFDPSYGYDAVTLSTIDFAIANPIDAIFVDHAFSFTCLCTHEAGALAEPQFVLTDAKH